jgi:replicative DNA helicase
LRPERFYSLQNQKIFEAILSLDSRGIRGDIVTLIDELRSNGNLEAAGGPAYISSLTDTVPTSANVEYYAKIVFDQYIRRELINLSSKSISEAHNDTVTSELVLEEAQKRIFELSDSKQSQNVQHVQNLIGPIIENIEKVYKNKKELVGVPSGLTELDSMTYGFQNSEMIIIGARPSMGKTALALSMIQHIAIEKKIPTAFFSLEMSNVQVMQRLLSQEARLNGEKIRTGTLKIEHFQRLQDAAGRIYVAPLWIDDTPNMKLLELRSTARRLRAQNKVEIIFIDYIGLIQNENSNLPRHEQIGEVSRSLKSLARELKIPIVVLSQVGRQSEGNRPTLADLRDSGSIEQDADVIMFLHRERVETNAEGEKPLTIPTQLLLSKQRNGPTGTAKIVFVPRYTKFENPAEE